MYSESIFIKSYKTAQRYFIVALTVFCPYSRYSVFKASETVAFIEWSTHFHPQTQKLEPPCTLYNIR